MALCRALQSETVALSATRQAAYDPQQNVGICGHMQPGHVCEPRASVSACVDL